MDKFEMLRKELQTIAANKDSETQFHSIVAEWVLEALMKPIDEKYEDRYRKKAEEMTNYYMGGKYKNNEIEDNNNEQK